MITFLSENQNNEMTVDIVIVNWNSGSLLKQCLRSISDNYPTSCEINKIIIVDNGSRDGSMIGIDDQSLPLETIYNNRNNGFASACNTGAARCFSKYLLFLNPDARLQKGIVDLLVAFLESNEAKDIGICGPQLINESGEISRTCARFPTIRNMIATTIGIDRIGFKKIKSNYMWDWDHSTSQVVDQVIGAFFLVRNSLFLNLQGFDERFFVYFEELDFSLRAKNLGFGSYYYAGAGAFHDGCGCTNQVKAMRLFYNWRSRILYVYKHMGLSAGFIILLCTTFFEPLIRLVKGLLTRRYQNSWEAIAAGFMLLRDLPKIISVGLEMNQRNFNHSQFKIDKR